MSFQSSPCRIELKEISKEFADNKIKACNRISLSVYAGEILALMGENGAGKSTLMHILSGLLTPDGGTFTLGEGSSVGMIHQKPILARNLTVWENIALGHASGDLFLNPRRIIGKIQNIQKQYNLPLDLNSRAGDLTGAQIQRAELLESLLLNRDILVFDEPSASLSEQQTEELSDLIRLLKKEGRTIIYITHKISETYALADRVAVIRKGSLVKVCGIGEIQPNELSAAMIGSGREMGVPLKRRRSVPDPESNPILALQDISYSEQGSPRLKNLNLELRSGEILGIGGIRENGLEHLEDLITGAIRPRRGSILLNSRPMPYLTPFRLRRHGISYIPADRLTRGASLDSTLGENLILLKKKFSGKSGSYRKALLIWAGNLIRKSDIKGHPDQPARTLSGGNIQKMILTREMYEAPSLLIISEPSWGLDFASREKLHQQILKSREEGSAVLLLTTDIDELLLLSDRIGILTAGELTETPSTGEEWTRKTIGECMTGADRL